MWNLPGGGLEKGESPWDGTIREVKEETGFDVEIVRLSGVYSKPDKNEIILNFECKIIGGEATLNDEAKDIKWFALDEIPHNTSPKHIERIKDLLEDKQETIMKVQGGKSSIELIKEGKL
jgi:ADP-ribose pyrophosphatase YjhB (NUDIX family)